MVPDCASGASFALFQGPQKRDRGGPARRGVRSLPRAWVGTRATEYMETLRAASYLMARLNSLRKKVPKERNPAAQA